ncbi:MAG: thiamine biosynthesis lipoprotein [Crocinitomicaceae bacterium]|jgi:thiamine biosynthesis lipoprotein
MFGIKKHKTRNWSVIISACVVLLLSCASPIVDSENDTEFGGEFVGATQGTTYNIIVANEKVNFSQNEIDSILHDFDLSLSTYIEESAITKLNNAETILTVEDPSGYFKECYAASGKVFELTDGAFDPSVFPLVEGWGFMKNVDEPMSDQDVATVMNYIGFDQFHTMSFKNTSVTIDKEDSRFKLDFNAIAQGYSVDVLDDFLSSRGQKNYYIEIGGELIVRGVNREGVKWRIGIDAPKEHNDTHELDNIIYVSNESIATSGNYRKFYEKDGKKFAHTLNPKTGYPVEHSLLSVTVIADNCTQADAYATAFMVMGTQTTIEFVENHPELNLKVYLLEAGDNGGIKRVVSKDFQKYLEE